MRKRASFAVVLAVLALMTAACAGSTPHDAETNELVWAVGGTDAQPGRAHHDTVRFWNEAHPDGPKVRLETLRMRTNETRQQLSLELGAQSDAFDILGLDVIWTGEFAENGWLESLEDIRPRIEGVSLDGPFESGTWGGELWAAPYMSNAALLYYRTDLVDHPPKTWQEAMEVGRRAAEKAGIEPFVGQGAPYEGMVVNYLEYLWGAGGDLFSKDMSEVLYGDGPALQALNFMRTALESGFYAPGFNTMAEEEASSVFQSGNAVFMRNWPSRYALLKETGPINSSEVADRFGIAPLPTFTGKGTVSALGGINLAVSAFSKNVEAAKEFVVFAATNANVQRNLGKRSVPPAMASVYEDLRDDPVMAQLAMILREARPRPPVPEWQAISDEIQQQVFPAYNGERDPQQAVDAIRMFLESIVE
jgi:multiple sugar transport system substrate-binding protein